jgi:N-[(2S)-2-amino-2-carboxyethyl]-L-glutamate dehydrogenase
MKENNLSFNILTGKIINQLILEHAFEIYEAVKEAYLLHENGEAINPGSSFLRFPDKPSSRIIALPASLPTNNVSGIKWISSNPDNIKHSLPRASAVIILNDYETGYPFACMEGAIISATRTACSAVLGAEFLNGQKKSARCLGVIGCGVIAKTILKIFSLLEWEFDEVLIFDSSKDNGADFSKEVEHLFPKITQADSLEELIEKSDIIQLATTALTPYLDNQDLFSHNPIILNISLRDISPEVMIESHNIVDDIDHVLAADTSPHLTEKHCGHRDFIQGTIAQLVNGTCVVAADRTRIFSPMGMGILDLAVAMKLFDKALDAGSLIEIEDFHMKNRWM